MNGKGNCLKDTLLYLSPVVILTFLLASIYAPEVITKIFPVIFLKVRLAYDFCFVLGVLWMWELVSCRKVNVTWETGPLSFLQYVRHAKRLLKNQMVHFLHLLKFRPHSSQPVIGHEPHNDSSGLSFLLLSHPQCAHVALMFSQFLILCNPPIHTMWQEPGIDKEKFSLFAAA